MLPRYGVNPWVLSGALLCLLTIVAHLASRLGRRFAPGASEGMRSQVAAVQGAAAGTLALLLGFSFALSGSRFDAHRILVVDEANAIDDAWLRCDLLPEAARSDVRTLLRRYVDARLELAAAGIDEKRIEAANQKATDLQAEIWSRVATVARQDTRAVTNALLIQSVNEIRDLSAKRLLALETRVPRPVLLLLAFAAAGAIASVAFGFGLVERRHQPATLFLTLLVTITAFVILDLDRPRMGAVKVSQRAMELLRDSINR